MRPKIFDLLYRDDRVLVLEVVPVTTRSSRGVEDRWAVIARRNVPGYPPFRSDDFETKEEATDFFNKVIVETPRVSLKNKPSNPLPTLDEFTAWLIEENLYDPILNPDASVNEN
jgi:hypothetical protein